MRARPAPHRLTRPAEAVLLELVPAKRTVRASQDRELGVGSLGVEEPHEREADDAGQAPRLLGAVPPGLSVGPAAGRAGAAAVRAGPLVSPAQVFTNALSP